MIYICGVLLVAMMLVAFVGYACCVVAGRADDLMEEIRRNEKRNNA